MVGLVIVSHSRALAEALVELVEQVASSEVPLAIAAGIGPDRSEIGTDASEIVDAIQSVYNQDGVLVLMDLGSAILSAEMALELLPPEMQARIRFCAAPLVEGAIAAGVQASLGMDLMTVCSEARSALLPKIEHIEAGAPEQAPAEQPAPDDGKPGEPAQEVALTLQNLHGLHARPAARFVQAAVSFEADIQVKNLTNRKGPVSARSLNSLATLGAVRGHEISVSASGPQASQALQALSRLVAENFGESAQEAPLEQPARQVPAIKREGALQAVPVSDGIAVGPLYRYQPPPPPISEEPAEDPRQEWDGLQQALEKTQVSIRQRRKELGRQIGEAETAIFDAHLLILQDPDLLEQVRQRIFELGENAALAWRAVITQIASTYQSLDDVYLQQRAVDVQDVGNQVLFVLAGRTAPTRIEFPEPVILFAQELTPTETSQLDMSQVLGLVSVGGGPTSHSVILARALGIPAVVGVDASLGTLSVGKQVGLDGFEGTVYIEPDQETLTELRSRRQLWQEKHQQLLESSHRPAVMRDGRRIEVAANVGNLVDAKAAVQNGAEAIGLLRTEFLFLTRSTPPDEDEQLDALRQIGEVMDGRPVIVRTLDVGGDKELPYLPLEAEANPFLGVRAIRLSLLRPDIFITQLRAILRAGAVHNFRVMFPMVATLAEVQAAKSYLEQAHQALLAEDRPHCWPIETGIMIEIPSAALLCQQLAPQVDFFSIGTNDLTQYTLAAERGNPNLSAFADALQPAVLRLIQQVADAAHQHDKWVGVCGELAGDPVAVPVLAGLGVDELSLNPAGIPRVKEIIRRVDRDSTRELAIRVLQAVSAEEARRLAREFIETLSAPAG